MHVSAALRSDICLYFSDLRLHTRLARTILHTENCFGRILKHGARGTREQPLPGRNISTPKFLCLGALPASHWVWRSVSIDN